MVVVLRVDAADWYARSNLSQEVSFDDNVGLDTDDKRSELGLTSTARLDLGGRAQDMEVRLRSTFDFAVFPNESSLDSDDQRITLGGLYRTERSVFGLEGGLFRDTTRTSDFEDTGERLRDNKRREAYRIGPTWTHQLTPRNTLNAFVSYENVHQGTKDLDDNWRVNGGFGWAHQWSARTQVEARASGLHFKTGGEGNRTTDSANFQLGGSHAVSELWQVSFFAGPSLTWTDETNRTGPQAARRRTSDNDFSVSYALNASILYRAADRTTLIADLSRAIVPGSSSGTVRETNEAGLFLTHQVLEKVAFDLGARYGVQRNVEGGSNRRDFASISPGLRWRVAEKLTLRCSYRFRWQRFDDSGDTAEGNSVFATLSYELPRLSTSR